MNWFQIHFFTRHFLYTIKTQDPTHQYTAIENAWNMKAKILFDIIILLHGISLLYNEEIHFDIQSKLMS